MGPNQQIIPFGGYIIIYAFMMYTEKTPRYFLKRLANYAATSVLKILPFLNRLSQVILVPYFIINIG